VATFAAYAFAYANKWQLYQDRLGTNTGNTANEIVSIVQSFGIIYEFIAAALTEWVSKNGLFAPFTFKNELFTKTGSGQT